MTTGTHELAKRLEPRTPALLSFGSDQTSTFQGSLNLDQPLPPTIGSRPLVPTVNMKGSKDEEQLMVIPIACLEAGIYVNHPVKATGQ